jgi:hypothetical protein
LPGDGCTSGTRPTATFQLGTNNVRLTSTRDVALCLKCANAGHSSAARRTARVDPKRPSTDSRGSFSSSLLFHVDRSGFGPVFVLGSVATEVRQGETRQIAAILVADVVGYSRFAGRHRLHARLGERSSAAGEFPDLKAYLGMYTRQNAPPRIAQALASITA